MPCISALDLAGLAKHTVTKVSLMRWHYCQLCHWVRGASAAMDAVRVPGAAPGAAGGTRRL